VPTAVALLWTRHADDIKGVQEAAAFMTSIATRRFYYEGLAERVDPVVWKKILGWFTQLATGVALLPVIGLGLLASLRSRRPLFWIGLFGAAAIPVAIFFGGFEKHDYYWTALTPEVAAFAGLGAGWLFARARTTPQRGFLALLLLAAVGVSDAYARDYWSRMYPPLSDFEQVLPRARELASLSAPDDKIVVIGRDYDPDLAYYARRRMLMLTAENETGHLVARLPAEGYRILFSWNPTQNEIGILRAWRWIGAIGPRTYATADTPRDLRGAEVIAADDVTVIDSIVRAGTPLEAPLRIPCDLATHTVPAGASGTWLRIAQPDPNARVTVDTLLAPLPARSVIAFRPAASLGARQVRVSCSGGGELMIEAAYDAPLPD